MNRTCWLVAFVLAVIFICTGVGYKLGYDSRHPPKYIYVKYGAISNNLVKVLNDCGVHLDKDQQQAIFERLKIERGNK